MVDNRKRKGGLKKMRELIYKAIKGNETIETASYSEKENLKNQGYIIKEVMKDITPPEPADALK